jgi:hypothetical protein
MMADFNQSKYLPLRAPKDRYVGLNTPLAEMQLLLSEIEK